MTRRSRSTSLRDVLPWRSPQEGGGFRQSRLCSRDRTGVPSPSFGRNKTLVKFLLLTCERGHKMRMRSLVSSVHIAEKETRKPRRKAMTHRKLGFIAATTGALLFAGASVAQAHGPGFGGPSSGHAGGIFQGPSTRNRQAFSSQSLHGPANLFLGRPYMGAKPGYGQSFVRPTARTYNKAVKKNTTAGNKENPSLTAPPQPPAAAPASMAMSSPGYALAAYSASYCATPHGNCHLARPQTIGDHCWCVGPAGQHENGAVR